MNPESVPALLAWSAMVNLLFPLSWRVRLLGAQNLPPKGTACIFTCNHPALIDSFWLQLKLRRRLAICGAKPKYYTTPLRRGVLGMANIRRIGGRQEFLITAGRLLGAGKTLLVYPEMGRYPDGLGPFQPWVSELSIQHNTPLIPCYLAGTGARDNRRLTLVIGEMLPPEGSPEFLTERLRVRIDNLGAGLRS